MESYITGEQGKNLNSPHKTFSAKISCKYVYRKMHLVFKLGKKKPKL